MEMSGVYRFALLAKADEEGFIKHMTDVVFKNPSALQLTRTTTGFTHRLLKAAGPFRQYAWHVTVDLMTDAPYDFGQNIERVQRSIEAFGVLIGVEAYTPVGS